MDDAWTDCYRVRPSLRKQAIAGIAVFVLLGVGMALATWHSPARLPHALECGCFFSAVVLLEAGFLLYFRRYRLLTSDAALCQIGVVRRQYTALSAVEELKWRRIPQGGGVRLTGAFGVTEISFGLFTAPDRTRLVRFLRQAVERKRQRGWGRFWRKFERAPAKREISRRVLFWSALGLVAVGGVFSARYFVIRDIRVLVLTLLNMIVGGCTLWWLYRQRRPELRAGDRQVNQDTADEGL